MAQHNQGFISFNPVADAFLSGDETTKNALIEAKKIVGDDEWNFTNEKRDQVRAILKENGARYDTTISGKLMDVKIFDVNKGVGDPKNKLHVVLESENGKATLSVDMNKDFTHSLIRKLETAQPGQYVIIGSHSEEQDKLDVVGKPFAKVRATLADQNNQKILENPNRFDEGVAAGNKAAEEQKERGKSTAMQKADRKDAIETYYTELANSIHNNFVEQGIAPTQAEKKGPLPGHEANLLSAERGANDEEKWYSLRVYPDKEGNLLATLTAQEDKNLISRQSKLEVKDGKDGGLEVHGDGFRAEIGSNRQVQFFEGKNKTPIQGKNKNTALLHPAKGTDITSPGMKNLQKILDTRLGQGKDRNVGKEV